MTFSFLIFMSKTMRETTISEMSRSAALLLTENGNLHLYCDGVYVRRLQTGLPVDKPLYGGVDVLGDCVQLKSEILSLPDSSNTFKSKFEFLSYCTLMIDFSIFHKSVGKPPMSTFENSLQSKPVKVEVPESEKPITIVPKGLGVAVKFQPKSTQSCTSSPTVIFFGVCSSELFAFSDGAQVASPIYLISSDKTLDEEVEVMVQHFLNITTNEHAKSLTFFVGKPPTDGSNKVHLIPKPGKFEANDELGSFKTK